MSVEPSSQPEIENLMGEGQIFPPPPEFAAQANATSEVYAEAAADPEAFWARLARERISWTKPFERTLEWDLPFAKWFGGGELNISYNCLDRHVERGLGDKVAYHWIGEPGDTRTLTYADLLAEVSRAANALRELGVEKGDRVAIYMPMIPELPVAMLACARLGAAHTVVFGGFSAEALSDRINDAQAKVLITADGGWRRGKAVDLKTSADLALQSTPSITAALVVGRLGRTAPMVAGRDHWWHELVARQSDVCPPVPVESEQMLYLLYTSGTTAKPKGIIHTTAGYLLQTSYTHEIVFDVKPDDVYWCAADIGWVTGHSYIVYGPLANATTGVMYEGAPDTPDWDRWWQIVEDYKVSILYCAPTAIRAFMKQGEQYPERHDLSSLRLLGSVGEPINPEAWLWYHEHIGGGTAADRRHLVADRDRRDPDQPAARRDHRPSPVRRPSRCPGSRPTSSTRGQERAARRWRLPRPQAAVAGDAARDLRRPGALPPDLLEPLPGDLLRRRRRQARQGRLPVAAGPGRRRHERGRPPDQHDRGRVGPRRPPLGGRGGRRRQDRPGQRSGDLRLRHPARRARSRRMRSGSSCASTSPRSSARSPVRST